MATRVAYSYLKNEVLLQPNLMLYDFLYNTIKAYGRDNHINVTPSLSEDVLFSLASVCLSVRPSGCIDEHLLGTY